ncbi:MAG: MFS transporter [Nitrospirae bacterium]|nr:MFS transporter [Nitrospirota bacterium]
MAKRLLSLPPTAFVLSALFVNGMAGGFVWPYFPIFLAEAGLTKSSIGLVLGISNILVFLVRLPLGRWLDHSHGHRFDIPLVAMLLAFPALLFLLPHTRSPAALVLLVLALALARLPFLPLGLARLKKQSDLEKKRFSPLLFVGAHHFFLGALGLLAGAVIVAIGIGKTFSALWVVVLLAMSPLLMPTPSGDGDTHPPPPPRLLPDREEVLVLLSFFFFHLVNAPLLPFAELYMKTNTRHPGWIPWIAAIAEIFMVVTALPTSRHTSVSSARLVLVTASGALALRMALYGFSPSAKGLLEIAILDGISSGLFWMASLKWVAERSGKDNTFNQMSGYVDLTVMTAGALGIILFGWVDGRIGFAGEQDSPGSFSRNTIILAPAFLLLAGKRSWSVRKDKNLHGRVLPPGGDSQNKN